MTKPTTKQFRSVGEIKRAYLPEHAQHDRDDGAELRRPLTSSELVRRMRQSEQTELHGNKS